MVTKLTFDDKPSPKTTSRTSTESRGSSIMETGFLGNNSASSDEAVFDDNNETVQVQPVINLCRDLINSSLDRFRGNRQFLFYGDL